MTPVLIHSLPVDLSLKNGDLAVILPVLLTTFGFIIFWFTSKSEKIKDRFHARSEFDRASVRYFLFSKIFGFIVLGLIPLIICMALLQGHKISYYGLSLRTDTLLLTILTTAALAVVVFPMASFSARKPKNLENYPQIRSRNWTMKTVWATIIGWTIYLFGYELLFRGVLLMPVADALGAWPAIAINVALYSATHVPKGLEETIGAIPLGLVLCIITLATGTIWTAFLVHLIMAVTNCLTAMKYHPEIVFKKA
ncbi:MAG: CPBP family intramembrane metalloprotease [Bacteroidales bacterium]|jgi:membrane protease YdiL (CAAX protease family)|nr:CPBP family intramembrane metalloprotease [Bacteroidales bacterium]